MSFVPAKPSSCLSSWPNPGHPLRKETPSPMLLDSTKLNLLVEYLCLVAQSGPEIPVNQGLGPTWFSSGQDTLDMWAEYRNTCLGIQKHSLETICHMRT
jgi:hypothetical protein